MEAPTRSDITLIETVNAHLRQLANVSAFNADEASLNAASNSLRLLLVDNCLLRAWKASGLGGAMTFRTWCIVSTKGNDVMAFCGGGDILPGMPFSACLNARLGELSLNLIDFCKRPRIQIGAVKVSTVELVKYVANTLGGAHFDPQGRSAKSRRPAFNLLRRLETGELSGFVSHVNGRNLLHHEVLSIAQTVIRSPDVARLRVWRKPAGTTGN